MAEGDGFFHACVDDGESSLARYKMSPLLVPGGTFPRKEVAASFEEQSQLIDASISTFVIDKLNEYPHTGGE